MRVPDPTFRHHITVVAKSIFTGLYYILMLVMVGLLYKVHTNFSLKNMDEAGWS